MLKPRQWLLLSAIGLALVASLTAAAMRFAYGWGLPSLVLLAIGGLASGYVAELLMTRLILGEGVLEIRTLGKRKSCDVAELAGVTWEKGSGVALKLVSGGWLKLPELGYDSQALTNTVRAWLKRQSKKNKRDDK